MRELAVLTMRSRSRSLVLTGKSRVSSLLTVTYWPSRPAIIGIMEIAEAGLDGAVVLQPPVSDNQHEVAVDLDGCALIDDQNAIKPSGQLLRRSEVGVIPERTGIRWGKVVVEALARLDWRLSRWGTPSMALGSRKPCQCTIVA